MSAVWKGPFGGCWLCNAWHLGSSGPPVELPWLGTTAWGHLRCIADAGKFNIQHGESRCVVCRKFRPINSRLKVCRDCLDDACIPAKCQELNDSL